MKNIKHLLIILALLVLCSLTALAQGNNKQKNPPQTQNVTYTAIIPPDVLTLFLEEQGYQAQIPDPANPGQMKPNPETVQQFVIRTLDEFIHGSAVSAEKKAAAEAAREAAGNTIRGKKLRP